MNLFIEKYRPQSLDEYVGNERIKEKFADWIEKDEIPHLLFHGKAGTGKTTMAKILVNNIDCDDIYINASDENSVDTVRDKIKGFASTVGFSKWKIIVLDECLDENTLVTILRDGDDIKVPIKDVDEHNDLVKSYNVDNDKIEYRPFYLWDKGKQDVYEIELENGEVVVCTGDHKWYVEEPDGNVEVVKTIDLHKYNHILSPQ